MPDEPRDPWTQVLDFLSKLITPVWNDLIPLLPLALVGLIALFFLNLALQWRRAGALNRSRLARPLRAGAPPAGVHLPGPSRWPFVLPIAGTLVFFALALAPRRAPGETSQPFNFPLLAVGLLVGVVAVAGWLRDAMHEWRRTASAEGGIAHIPGAHPVGGGAVALAGPARRLPLEPPPGVHLPGPSPWPFLAPIALLVLFFGVVLHPALILGGIVMGAIAALGWLRDAGSEYRQTDAGHAPEPTTRDPARAFPRRLVKLYGAIFAACLVIAFAPGVIGFLTAKPSPAAAGGGTGGGTAPSSQVEIAAQTIQFTKKELVVVAGTPFTITFDNHDPAPHNVAILHAPGDANPLFQGEIFAGPGQRTYNVPAIPAGSYPFVCSVHANMTGTLVSK